MTVEQARKRAAAALAEMFGGVNPNTEKRARGKREMTLDEVMDAFALSRKTLKANTVADYRKRIREMFPDWAGRPLTSITRDMIAARHAEIGRRSPSQADKGMRILRALFNYAMGALDDGKGGFVITDNPVERLTKTRAWYGSKRRRTLIEPHQFRAWFAAVLKLQERPGGESGQTMRDYLLFLILTGLRREEAARLRWTDVDHTGRKFTIADTKNGEPHTLPLSDYLLAMLKRRNERAINAYVFPGSGPKGHLVNPYKAMGRVTTKSGVAFALHDLRRTFLTVAERLDIPAYAIKTLANHKMRNDVTAGYLVIDVERLRGPMQKITDFTLSEAGLKPSAQIYPIHPDAPLAPISGAA